MTRLACLIDELVSHHQETRALKRIKRRVQRDVRRRHQLDCSCEMCEEIRLDRLHDDDDRDER